MTYYSTRATRTRDRRNLIASLVFGAVLWAFTYLALLALGA